MEVLQSCSCSCVFEVSTVHTVQDSCLTIIWLSTPPPQMLFCLANILTQMQLKMWLKINTYFQHKNLRLHIPITGFLGWGLPEKYKHLNWLCWNNSKNCRACFYHPLNQDELEYSLIKFLKVHPSPDVGFWGRFKRELWQTVFCNMAWRSYCRETAGNTHSMFLLM